MSNIKELQKIAKNLTVLYVEDEKELRNSVQLYLLKIFNKVTAVADGLEGLNRYNEHPYDIVISDIQMPNMNGLQMALEIKSINPNQEIIIISAYAESNYFLDAIRLGINDYIIKPINYLQMNQVLYKAAVKLEQIREIQNYKLHLEEMVQQRTREVLALEKEKEITFEKTILSFIEMIEDRDTYTAGHSQRVAEYSKLIAKEMGRSDEECDLIYHAGILHDIGKIATPDTILLRPGKLNELEYKLIQEHVKVGYRLLKQIPMYAQMAEIMRYHHERYNGTGYPNGLKGDEIPILAHIMILADAFDAMTTNRIYKSRKNIKMAIQELQELTEKQFHPDVVKAAVVALRDVKVIDNTSQLPETEIEKERFAYFYRDQLTAAYNAEYLNFILNRNVYNREFTCINILYLHNFTQYNDKHGWAEGDKLLNDVVDFLSDTYPKSLIFRIHGDDFVIISKAHLEIDMNQFEHLKIFEKHHVSLSKYHISLDEEDVSNIRKLEVLI
jgi:diguanylate cyclase (GGDEF)-like protein/putative nucleotidyltransferase with HDIG domain